ncbi:MAG: TerB family tellurite resistance protein [Deltaproteobacteria bacterium]|nr:TerB family tellurite resistance protein [Deltaproteobacteria bacterium]
MLDIFKSAVQKIKGPAGSAVQTDEALELQIATCALLLEMAHADDTCTPAEEAHIAELMQQRFGLSREAFDEVCALSECRRRDEIDLWGFTSTIKKGFSAGQKMQLMEMLWSVIYADEVLADYEDHLVHTVAKLLGMDHRDMIAAKVKVLNAQR